MKIDSPYSYRDIADNVSEEDKLKEPYLKGNIIAAINDLIDDNEKIELEKAYLFAEGVRSKDEYTHLTSNYGIGNPTDIPFIPIMMRAISALIGKGLQNHLDYEVNLTNTDGLSYRLQSKKYSILNYVYRLLNEKKKLTEKNLSFLSSKENKFTDLLSDGDIEDIKKKYGESWKTDIEIAAKDFITNIVQDKELQHKFSLGLRDLIITGSRYERVYVDEYSNKPDYILCNPLDIFHDKRSDTVFLEDCRRVVYRMWKTRTELLKEYGHLLSDDEQEKIAELITDYYTNRDNYRERLFLETENEDVQIVNHHRHKLRENRIEVLHVEWIATNVVKDDKVKPNKNRSSKDDSIKGNARRQDRYEGYFINIGTGIFFGMGKCNNVVRKNSDPLSAKLTYNGIAFRGRNYKPFSFVLATKDIQDISDIAYYQRNNLLAHARVGGNITVLEHIPTAYGDSPEERILKDLAYKKIGANIVSISQEGNDPQSGYGFNNYGSYDPNLNGGLITAYNSVIDMCETQAYTMVGLNRQMLAEIEERDGKGTTMMAVQNGELVIKELMFTHGMLIKRTLTNLVNLSRITLNGKEEGKYIIGHNNNIYSIDANNYSICDFGIYITDEFENNKINAKIDSYVENAIAAGMLPLKQALELASSRSAAQKRQTIQTEFDRQQQDAKSQLEQLNTQLQEIAAENEKLKEELKKASEIKAKSEIEKSKLDLDNKKFEFEKKIKQRELSVREQYNMGKLEAEEEKIELQKIQAIENPTNTDNKIRFD